MGDTILKDPKTGRFLAGTKGGGRPKGNSTEEWSRKLRTATGRHFKRLFYALLNQALSGDTKANIWLLERLVGKMPTNVELTQVEPDTKNLAELREQFDELFRNRN